MSTYRGNTSAVTNVNKSTQYEIQPNIDLPAADTYTKDTANTAYIRKTYLYTEHDLTRDGSKKCVRSSVRSFFFRFLRSQRNTKNNKNTNATWYDYTHLIYIAYGLYRGGKKSVLYRRCATTTLSGSRV